MAKASKYMIGLKTLDGQRVIRRYCEENRLSRVSGKCNKSEGLRKYTSHRGNRYEMNYQIAVRSPGMFHKKLYMPMVLP